jgi:acetyl-CoA acyltransferase
VIDRLGAVSTAARAVVRSVASGMPEVVLVDACRTPFQVSGSGFKAQQAWQLARMALHGLATRNPSVELKHVDHLYYGSVIQEVKTANVGREAALVAGYPRSVPATTMTMACISSNAAIAAGSDKIRAGQADIIVAGGVETMSDVPIRFSRELRARMIASQKAKGVAGYLKLLKGFRLSWLAPELPAVAEFSTNEVMGHSADRLAAAWGVSRLEQDEYALRSHQFAAAASSAGLLTDRLTISVPAVADDNGIKADSTLAKLQSLKPAFIKPHGTVTAASSSFLTDGASAALIMSKTAALDRGIKPRAYLLDSVFTGMDPAEELLLGPAYSIVKLLQRNNLKVADIGVWEIHEAFAGQVLANLNALESKDFCELKAGGTAGAVGRLPMDKINLWGGSLSIGHPFAATGVRLVTTAASRLHHENHELAVVSACAAGGLGTAMLVKRFK